MRHFRHTFASSLIQNGESLAYVKEQSGHSSIRMTVDIYGHLVPGPNQQAVNRLPIVTDFTTLCCLCLLDKSFSGRRGKLPGAGIPLRSDCPWSFPEGFAKYQ